MKKLITILTVATVSLVNIQSVRGMNCAPNGQQNSDYIEATANVFKTYMVSKGVFGVKTLSTTELYDAYWGMIATHNFASNKGVRIRDISDSDFRDAYIQGLPVITYPENENATVRLFHKAWRRSAYFAVRETDPATLSGKQIIEGLEQVENLLDTATICATFLQRHINNVEIRPLVETMPEECAQRSNLARENRQKIGNGITGDELIKVSKWMVIERYKMQDISAALLKECFDFILKQEKISDEFRKQFNEWRLQQRGITAMPQIVKDQLSQ